MIHESHGNLLDSDAEALVNTVNTVGVMGKGIALQFSRRFPDMFRDYERAAKRHEVRLGQMHIWGTGAMTGPQFVINFPTKGHWRARSQLPDIEAGLADLVRVVREKSISSIAVPPLGCGNGGLDWAEVQPLIESAFARLPDVDVRIFPPEGVPDAADMTTRTARPVMTVAKAAFIAIMRRYSEITLDVSLIEIQKLMYFLQVAGEDMRLDYTKGRYGPYADNLRKALRSMEGHFITGFGDGSKSVQEAEPVKLLPGASDEADHVLDSSPSTVARIERVVRLSEGFESAYGLELLASVHWVATHENTKAAADPKIAGDLIGAWNARKHRMMGPDHVAKAWSHLRNERWLTSSARAGAQ
ncbi:MAG: macro domain-containing protein [Pseudonocardiaceae bacterium]